MKKYFVIAAVSLIVILGSLLGIFVDKYNHEKLECQRYQHNTQVLLSDVKMYKTKNSLNAAKTEQLEFTNKELRKLLADDANEIKRLDTKNRELLRLLKIGSSTSTQIEASVRDTIFKTDSIEVPSKCFDYTDNYLDIHGCIVNKVFQASITMEDTLYITETIKYKRFLGFLWKTNKIKS